MKTPFLCLLLSSTSLPAQLTRGPYIQLATPSSMSVLWRTSTTGNAVVRYGTDPDALTQSAVSTGTLNHEVKLTALTAAMKYFYAVDHGAATLASGPTFHFTTHPSHGANVPTRFWAIGDFGVANINQTRVRDAFCKYQTTQSVDLITMLGDNAYSTGTDAQYQAAVFNIYPGLLRNTVAWSCLGNHDAGLNETDRPIPYDSIFAFPAAAEGGGVASGTERYYSFNHGLVHFVSIDSMIASRLANGPMAAWLAADLQANTQPWVIAFWHHPPYDTGTHNSDYEHEQIEMRENIVPLLESYGVDLVMCGHSHVYQRSYLINNHLGLSTTYDPAVHSKNSGDGNPASDGAYTKPSLGMAPFEGCIYTVCGNSGQSGSFHGGFHPANAVNLTGTGSLIIEVNGPRLDGKYLRSIANPNDPLVFDDSFAIIKGVPGTPPPNAPFVAPGAPVFLPLPGASLLVAWNDPNSNETSYELEFSPDGEEWEAQGILPANRTWQMFENIFPGSGFYVRVSALRNLVRKTSESVYHEQPLDPTATTAAQQWRFSYFRTTAATGLATDMADADKDGLANLLEYGCGSHPLEAGSMPTILAQLQGGRLAFTFPRAARTDLQYTVEFSSDLSENSWAPGLVSSGLANSAGNVQALDPLLPSPPRRFARLNVIRLQP